MRSVQQADYAPQISIALAPIDRDRIVAEIIGDEAALTAPLQTPLAGGIVIAELPNAIPVIPPTPTTLLITPTPVLTVTVTAPTPEVTEPIPTTPAPPSPTSPPPPTPTSLPSPTSPPPTPTSLPSPTSSPPTPTLSPPPSPTSPPTAPPDTPTPVPPPDDDDDDDNLPPTALADTAVMAEDGLAIAIPVLANDSDPDGAIVAATLTIVTGPTNGTITINTTTGEIVYTPNLNFNGVETLVYLICDNDNDCSTATVTITVTPVNDPPVAVDDAATTGEDTLVTINVLLNDFDVDGDPLTLISTTTPAGGIIVVNLDSSLTYTPNPDFSGVDTFTYQISDGLATATATVTITVTPVNDPPIAVDDEATNAEDTSQLIDVLANDINTDGPNPLTIIATSQPANGTVVIEPPRIRYTPNPNFDEVDTFTYTITDGLLTATAIVTVTIIPINDAPVAVDDSYSTSVDTPLVVLAPGVLGNDTDVEGSGLTVVLGTIINPANGSLIPFADGSLTYTPNPGFTGIDTFSYQVTDGAATSNFATVTISVP